MSREAIAALIGARVAAQRAKLNLSQSELARQIDGHRNTVWMIEHGVQAPTFSTLYAIHAPGVPSGYYDAPLSLVQLLNHHLGGEPLRAPDSCRVFLLEEDGEKALTAVEPKFCAP